MSFWLLSRRLWKPRSSILPSLISPPAISSSPPSNKQLPHLYVAFRRTALLLCPRFCTFQYSSSQSRYCAFEFIQHDPQEAAFLGLLKRVAAFAAEAEVMASLDASGIVASQDLVCSVIWKLRDDWRQAFLAFKWGQERGCTSCNTFELIVWVLGNHKKFNIAWCLLRDLYQSGMDMRPSMFIMIDRYAAANDSCKAIEAFRIMDKFRLTPDEEAFHVLLEALCKHGYVEEAEEFMLANKKLFPLDATGFNIILNGWCNHFVDALEAKRVWREMSSYCITPDATSYSHLISCFSKVGNLFDSLRLYDEMKKKGFVPRIRVYNSLVHVLARESCVNEALKLLDKMKQIGVHPDSSTYNSILLPLCEAEKVNEARDILSAMTKENLNPTIDTYHALLKVIDLEETEVLLHQMKTAGLVLKGDTFLLILERYLKIKQPLNALKIWDQVKKFGFIPESCHYTTLIRGLASSGLLDKAKEFYAEMTSNGFSDDPKLKRYLKEQLSTNEKAKRRERRGFKRINMCNSSKATVEKHKIPVKSKKKSRKESFGNSGKQNPVATTDSSRC